MKIFKYYRQFSFWTAAMGLIWCNAASAQSLTAGGTIYKIEVAQGNNFAFRIFMKQNGVDSLSNCAWSFAYINTSDDNYQAKVSALLSAYHSKKAVLISYDKLASTFCQIVFFAVSD